MEEETNSALANAGYATDPAEEASTPVTMNVGGMMEVKNLAQTLQDEQSRATEESSAPYVQSLVAHVKKCWREAQMAKQNNIEPRMMAALRQRKGEYEPDMLTQLQSQGSAIVYMLLTSNKCRAASAWLREALSGLPWKATPTPVADIDDTTKQGILMATQELVRQSILMGYQPKQNEVRGFMLAMKDKAFAEIQQEAKDRAERMTEKMKDQLIEGGFEDAMDAFIDDLVTFPAAILKGPVVRKRPMMKWVPGPNGEQQVAVEDSYKLEWERVDPFNIYPAPESSGIDDGYLIERHKLSRGELADLRDVEGYSASAITSALADYGETGLQEMLSVDSERRVAEDKEYIVPVRTDTIEALQFWGSVQGKMLIEWGMDESEVEDPMAEYHIEAWLVGNYIIKATINPDPLHRKPYYKTSWECIPGLFWGRSIPDLCADTQKVCNAAARALVNNMSLSSGPQVAYDVSRLPQGENLSQMYPWKIWQFKDSGLAGSTVQPISFFQPQSNAAELMQIYNQFSTLADEYTGIPRYMTGDSNVGGAGKTASGMSMLMTNAGKTIKNVIASVDRILKPAIERLYMYNMMYLDDPELKGDVNIQVEGAEALVRQQQQQARLNEFLNIATSNPVVNQIIGPKGVAYLLREVAKTLGVNTDEIIPAMPILEAQQVQAQIQAAAAQQALAAQQQQAMGQPQAGGSPRKPENAVDQRRLMDGSPQANAQVKTPVAGPKPLVPAH